MRWGRRLSLTNGLYSVQCTVYSVQYSVQYTVYSVQPTTLSGLPSGIMTLLMQGQTDAAPGIYHLGEKSGNRQFLALVLSLDGNCLKIRCTSSC